MPKQQTLLKRDNADRTVSLHRGFLWLSNTTKFILPDFTLLKAKKKKKKNDLSYHMTFTCALL